MNKTDRNGMFTSFCNNSVRNSAGTPGFHLAKVKGSKAKLYFACVIQNKLQL